MKRGEIWLVELDPTIDREINKTRPAIITNDDEIGVLPVCNWNNYRLETSFRRSPLDGLD